MSGQIVGKKNIRQDLLTCMTLFRLGRRIVQLFQRFLWHFLYVLRKPCWLIKLPRYLKCSTCSSSWFPVWILILRILFDFWHIITLVFCQLIISWYFWKHLAISSSALSKSCSLLVRSTISSANLKNYIISPPTFMPILFLRSVFLISLIGCST